MRRRWRYRSAEEILPRLTLSFLGCFHVCLNDRPVTDFKSNKVRALLAYLAVEADRPHRREALAGLLWPDRTDRDALSNLRYALASLRRTIGDHAAMTALPVDHTPNHPVQPRQRPLVGRG